MQHIYAPTYTYVAALLEAKNYNLKNLLYVILQQNFLLVKNFSKKF